MHATSHLASLSFVLLDILLIWGCWAVDSHFQLEAAQAVGAPD